MKRQLLLFVLHEVLRMPCALHALHSRFPDLVLACIGAKPDFRLCAFKIYKISQFSLNFSRNFSQFRLSERLLYLLRGGSDLILLVLALALRSRLPNQFRRCHRWACGCIFLTQGFLVLELCKHCSKPGDGEAMHVDFPRVPKLDDSPGQVRELRIPPILFLGDHHCDVVVVRHAKGFTEVHHLRVWSRDNRPHYRWLRREAMIHRVQGPVLKSYPEQGVTLDMPP